MQFYCILLQYFNKSLEDLYETLREKQLCDKRKLKELEKARRREFEIYQGIKHAATPG